MGVRGLVVFFSASLVVASLLAVAPAMADDDVHWSREFAKPPRNTEMGPGTGMSDGGGKPSIARAKWHEGRLYIAGAWEPGVDGRDPKKRRPNNYWHLWSYSPVQGWEAIAHFHTAQGGVGPDGVINDFEFLPDGRLVVGGEFTRLYNPAGNRYHKVNGLAIYDPNEPTANKWKPLGTVQYNGTVSAGGSIQAIAYDPQGNDLYVGGSFPGIPKGTSSGIHRYDFDTNSYEPMSPGIDGAKPYVYRLQVDPSTSPSTVYVAGKFHYTSGNGLNPEVSASTAKYSTSFAAWQEGTGWKTFPSDHPTDGSAGKEAGILQRASDFAAFDSVRIYDFLLDGDDIWIVGAFSEGSESGETLRGIAKWDAEREVWTDPTGKGGVGRDVFNVAKVENGKIYFSGAFGGRKGVSEFYDGFKNGDPGALAISYDPATGEWAQLGSGLSSNTQPEVRMAVNGNDVYFLGDFEYINPAHFDGDRTGDKAHESWYIARWNEGVDFVAAAPAPEDPGPNPFAVKPPTKTRFADNGNWSTAFPKPPRPSGKNHKMTGATGMDDSIGAPTQVNGMGWHDGTLYLAGNWEAIRGERWYVWTYNKETGWAPIAWQKGGKKVGPASPPEGLKWHDGKMYVFGAIRSHSGVAVYDPATGEWSNLEGTFDGKPVVGNAVKAKSGPINDIEWDEKTGDMYMVGSTGLSHIGAKHPKDVARVIRVDKDGVYHPMGHALKPEDPGKPTTGIYTVLLDQSKDPVDIYVAGTFNYYGPTPTSNKRMAYNVAKWDREANDWRPVGSGEFTRLKEIDAASYPDGLHGLPAMPERYPTFLRTGFPRIRDMVMDKDGNIYAGGTLGIVDNTVPVADRTECFGIAKYDAAADKWVCPVKSGGVSRDIFQMTFLDDEHLLLSGSFINDNNWNELHNVAILNVVSGELMPLGGGLTRKGKDQTVGSNVSHTVNDEGIWFAGLFDHAGAAADSATEKPNSSNYIALWKTK